MFLNLYILINYFLINYLINYFINYFLIFLKILIHFYYNYEKKLRGQGSTPKASNQQKLNFLISSYSSSLQSFKNKEKIIKVFIFMKENIYFFIIK